MSELMPETTISNELVLRDEAEFQEKLGRFINAGAANLHMVLDFDRTLTFTTPEADAITTSWQVLQAHLPAEGQRRQSELFEKYHPIESQGTLTTAEAQDWWEDTLSLFVEYKLNLAEVERQFFDKTSIRPGTQELFGMCEAAAVPAVILSAGVENIIELWAKTYNIKPAAIVSTTLTLDDTQRIVGWEASSLVHALNKAEIDHPELNDIRQSRKHAIVVGDGQRDADMATGESDVIRIRVFDPTPGKVTDMQEFREQSFQEFDAVIETGSLLPLSELLAKIS